MKNIDTINVLIKKLKSNNKLDRADAADALGELKAADAVPALLKNIGDKDWASRRNAVRSLGKIADQRALKPLVRMLDQEMDEVVLMAILVAILAFDFRDALDQFCLGIKKYVGVAMGTDDDPNNNSSKSELRNLLDSISSKDQIFFRRVVEYIVNNAILKREVIVNQIAELKSEWSDAVLIGLLKNGSSFVKEQAIDGLMFRTSIRVQEAVLQLSKEEKHEDVLISIRKYIRRNHLGKLPEPRKYSTQLQISM